MRQGFLNICIPKLALIVFFVLLNAYGAFAGGTQETHPGTSRIRGLGGKVHSGELDNGAIAFVNRTIIGEMESSIRSEFEYHELEELRRENMTVTQLRETVQESARKTDEEISRLEAEILTLERDIAPASARIRNEISSMDSEIEQLRDEQRKANLRIGNLRESESRWRRNGVVARWAVGVSGAVLGLLVGGPVVAVASTSNDAMNEVVQWDRVGIFGGIAIGTGALALVPWDRVFSTPPRRERRNVASYVSDLQEQIDTVQAQKQASQAELASIRADIDRREGQIEELETEQRNREERLSKVESELSDATGPKNDWEAVLGELPSVSSELTEALVLPSNADMDVVFPLLNKMETNVTLREFAGALAFSTRERNLAIDFDRALNVQQSKPTLLVQLERAGRDFVEVELAHQADYGWTPISVDTDPRQQSFNAIYDWEAEAMTYLMVVSANALKEAAALVDDVTG